MKAINAIYKHRHLYDNETGKRIILEENSEITITVQDNSILREDPYNPPHKAFRSRERIIEELKAKYDFVSLFLEKGSKLWFRVNAGEKVRKSKSAKKSEDDSNPEFIKNKDAFLFEIELDEDLFWVAKDNGGDSVVSECACTVVREYYNHLRFFEPIYAPSLNKAYTNTYEFYFPLYGSATASIYNTISLNKNGNELLRMHRVKFLK
jgi:hypothetical protein